MSRSTDQALSGWGVHLLPSYNALHSQYTLKTFRFEDEISRFFREGKGSQESISTVVRIYYIILFLTVIIFGRGVKGDWKQKSHFKSFQWKADSRKHLVVFHRMLYEQHNLLKARRIIYCFLPKSHNSLSLFVQCRRNQLLDLSSGILKMTLIQRTYPMFPPCQPCLIASNRYYI